MVARVACLAHPYRLSSLNGGAAGMVAGDHGLVDGTWTLATALKLAVHLEVTFGLIKERKKTRLRTRRISSKREKNKQARNENIEGEKLSIEAILNHFT